MDHAQIDFAKFIIEVVETTLHSLEEYKDAINRLNVYPVPDGDTGTNLYLTLLSVQQELTQLDADSAKIDQCVKSVSKGALMGARGNSGVIFSQIIRGFAEGIQRASHENQTIGVGIRYGLSQGSQLAQSAVLRPVEGTILTVARRTAEAADRDIDKDDPYFSDVLNVSTLALLETPAQLQVLCEAGVVDAGGAGYQLFIEAIARTIQPNLEVTPKPWLALEALGSLQSKEISIGEVQSGYDISRLKYEVMFLLEATENAVDAFKEVWAGVGDSIVVVGQDELWNCHIHTDDVGAAIEAAIEAGRPKNIRVTDLSEQVGEENWVIDAHGSGAPNPSGVSDEGLITGVIAVANGEGIGRIFRSMGVNRIILGGQSMNPSTADILAAVDGLAVENVVILPNNSNIFPVAKMAATLTKRNVEVLATRGIIEGFAALMEYDPASDINENVQAMTSSFQKVSAGEVTQAVRNSTWVEGTINKGDFLGLSHDGILAVDVSLLEVCKKLLSKLLNLDSEIVTLIEGEGSVVAITREIEEWLRSQWPGMEIEIHHGGQPLYPYLFGVE